MHPTQLHVGDTVAASPVGPGKVTDITDARYPRVNHVAVTCLKRTDGAVFDPHGHFKAGIPSKYYRES